jgi:hypothetical protein
MRATGGRSQRGRAMGGAWRSLCLILAMVILAGCNLDFSNDSRVSLISPRDMSLVHLPLRVLWTSHIPRGSNLSYALFVDRTPLSPGQSLRALADDTCKHTPGCPNAAWLAARGVFLTNSTSVRLTYLPTLSGTENQDLHTLTLVLLNADHRRSGEGAWSVSFRQESS